MLYKSYIFILYKTDPEDRRHMILQCSALSKIRDKYLPRFVNLIPEFNYINCDENIKIILDCTNAKCERANLEAVSIDLLYTAFTANGTTSLIAVAPPRKGGKIRNHHMGPGGVTLCVVFLDFGFCCFLFWLLGFCFIGFSCYSCSFSLCVVFLDFGFCCF